MPRLSREIVVTEKIDGTNAQVIVDDLCEQVAAASRSRLITVEDDNYGFAGWVEKNKSELLKLGPGRHFGEWWGAGIQRKYGLSEKRFSLFNTSRWWSEFNKGEGLSQIAIDCPICYVVPVLYRGLFTSDAVQGALNDLRVNGSFASPGFKDPEGVVVFHSASGTMFKKTLEKDDQPKGQCS